jgi:hypothetical protein
MREKVVWCGTEAINYFTDEIGMKGSNLLRLFNLAQKEGSFNVPRFFIVPVWASESAGRHGNEIEGAFEQLKKPVIVRSSSPLEDNKNASFAGMFESHPD